MITQDWIKSQNFQFRKINVRSYGVYELAASLDGQTWAAFSRPFGWGFTEIEAFEIILNDIVKDVNLQQSFQQWMGEELFNEMMASASTTSTALVKIEKESNVSEYIHNQ